MRSFAILGRNAWIGRSWLCSVADILSFSACRAAITAFNRAGSTSRISRAGSESSIPPRQRRMRPFVNAISTVPPSLARGSAPPGGFRARNTVSPEQGHSPLRLRSRRHWSMVRRASSCRRATSATVAASTPTSVRIDSFWSSDQRRPLNADDHLVPHVPFPPDTTSLPTAITTQHKISPQCMPGGPNRAVTPFSVRAAGMPCAGRSDVRRPTIAAVPSAC